MRLRLVIGLAAGLVLAAGTAAAEGGGAPGGPKPNPSELQGSAEDQSACSPDATRFCSEDFPDTFRVLDCLKKHRARLKKACLKVLEEHGQ